MSASVKQRSYGGLTSVVIPSSITYEDEVYSFAEIGDCASWDCSGQTSVEIPGSVTTI